jgi:DNA-binding transcriptional ArsR family regulator
MSSGDTLQVMKPLFHPSIDDITVEGILHALSDPVRVAIYVGIVNAACATRCSSFLSVNDRTIPKSTLSQHFKALREAGLIRGERSGVEMRNTSRCHEIDRRYPGLLAAIIAAHAIQTQGRLPNAKAAKRTSDIRTSKGR